MTSPTAGFALVLIQAFTGETVHVSLNVTKPRSRLQWSLDKVKLPVSKQSNIFDLKD